MDADAQHRQKSYKVRQLREPRDRLEYNVQYAWNTPRNKPYNTTECQHVSLY